MAGGSHEADLMAGADPRADTDVDPREVRIYRPDPVSVRNRDEVAPAPGHPSGIRDAAITSGRNACPGPRRKVDPGMEGWAARTEPVSQACLERADEPERRAWRWGSKRREGGRPGNAVRAEPRPTLKATERVVGAPPETAVKGTRGESVPGEEELKLRDVEADSALHEYAPAQERATAATKRAPRPPPGDSIREQASAALEPNHGLLRSGAVVAVDRAPVEPPGLKRNLDRGNARAPGRMGRGGDEEGAESKRQRDERPETHRTQRFRPAPRRSCAIKNPLQDHIGAAAEHERGLDPLAVDAAERHVR